MSLNLAALLQPAVKGATGVSSLALKALLAGEHQAGAQALQTQKLLPQALNFAPPPVAPPPPAQVDYGAVQNYYADPEHSDYHNDPVLLQVQAQEARDNANLDAGGLASRQQLLQQLGDPSLALAVLGKADPTLATISDSPDSPSALGRLARGYHDTVETNEDARNKANLWYSSTRGEGLRNDAQDYATQQHDTISAAQQALDQITQQIQQGKTSSHDRTASAESEAYQRYLNAIMQAPPGALPGPGSSSSDGAAPPSGPSSRTAGGGATFSDANSTGYGYAPPPAPKAPLSDANSTAGYAPPKPKPLSSFLAPNRFQVARNAY